MSSQLYLNFLFPEIFGKESSPNQGKRALFQFYFRSISLLLSNNLGKNHTHAKKVGTPHNFLLAFIDELWKTWKIRILKKWKKKLLKISSFYTCALKATIIYEVKFLRFGVRFFLSFWAIFCPFTPQPLRTQKTKILKKWKKHLTMSSF